MINRYFLSVCKPIFTAITGAIRSPIECCPIALSLLNYLWGNVNTTWAGRGESDDSNSLASESNGTAVGQVQQQSVTHRRD